MIQLIPVGGFLGAGKTTLLLAAARLLTARGIKVALVTNDQGNDLVDTALAGREQLTVSEVTGGCFCCRYPDLLKALATLQSNANPEVILIEPVGSCTDLLATVVRPLRHQFGDQLHIAPLTIVLDPLRNNSRFVAEVDYLVQRQLAEAEVAVVTKQDLPEATERAANAQATAMQSGASRVFAVSGATGAGVAAWLDYVLATEGTALGELAIDYKLYAAGEAALGWLNASGAITSSSAFSPSNWVAYLLHLLDASLDSHKAEIAHVKVLAQTTNAMYKASLTQSRGQVNWDLRPKDKATTKLSFMLNARVQAPPELLESVVRNTFIELSPLPDFTCTFSQFDCFCPDAPRPTHRIQAIA